MFDDEFFPTPPAVIQQMIAPFLKERRTGGYHDENELLCSGHILEPSAGKGDILDYIEARFRAWSGRKFYCFEQNPDLQLILKEKGYRLMGSDFLDYHGDHFFDLILMNPPFSNGDEHLLHAWDILKEGELVCLLNAETLLNPYTERRKLLASIIEQHGSYEVLGNVFSTAERKTDVCVALVRLSKAEKPLDFKFEKVNKEQQFDLDEETIKNPVATRDVVGNMVLQYEKLKEVFVEYLKAQDALKFYAQGLFGFREIADMIKSTSGNKKERFNDFLDDANMEVWKTVISKIGMERYMTSRVRENFSKFQKQQGMMDFTKENVQALIRMLLENSGNILEQAVGDVFDIFTSYYKENRLHVEGWKTNDKWKVNQKVILPHGVRYGEYMTASSIKQYGDKFDTVYDVRYDDIDKVMCYLTGTPFERCLTIDKALSRKFEIIGNVKPGDTFDNTCESQFFTMRFWKKGTLHLVFKDERLWQEFNMRACALKKWLPDHEEKEWRASKQREKEQLELGF